jgi:hypothetical protein
MLGKKVAEKNSNFRCNSGMPGRRRKKLCPGKKGDPFVHTNAFHFFFLSQHTNS